MSAAKDTLTFRAPSTSSSASTDTAFAPPTLDFLSGAWYVTHSTLPMWKSNRNVVITYTPLDSPAGSIDDLVAYNPIESQNLKTVQGVDTPDPDTPAAYKWRGRGWLKIVSSQWEILGYGEEDGGWVVTFFQKTLFTPAGIDIYARKKGGLSTDLLGRVVAMMEEIGESDFKNMVGTIFPVKHDW